MGFSGRSGDSASLGQRYEKTGELDRWRDPGGRGIEIPDRLRVRPEDERDNFEVTSSEPGKSFGVNTVEGPYPITADYGLVESADGQSTVISYTMDARSDSKFTATMFVITGWIAKPVMHRRLNKELQDLEQALDSS